jgi:peptide/nickel transport system permease protein
MSRKKAVSANQLALMWRKFKKHRLAKIGGTIVVLLLIITIFAPFFAPYDLEEQNLRATYVPPQRIRFFDEEGKFHFPFVYGLKRELDPKTYTLVYTEDTSKKYFIRFFTRSWEYKLFGIFKTNLHLFGVGEGGSIYLFGTDQHGRCLLSRIIFGGRLSLFIALTAAAISGIIGAVLGGISGYYAGVLDMLIQRAVELVRCFPQLALWMALSVAFPRDWNPIYIVYGIIGIFGLLSWPSLAREVRGKVLSYREEDFVLAAKAIGASDRRIILRHILPHTLSHVIVSMTILIPWLILGESVLSFLGVGIQPPMASWGTLMQKAQSLQVLGQYPWILIPGLFITITVLAFSFLGDGLRDAADPFSRY